MKYAPVHGWYWVLPALTALVWFAGLVTFLGVWAHQGNPRYKPSQPMPPFVSDVGAENLAVFRGFCIATAGLYIIVVFVHRWLRHRRRIPGSIERHSTYYDIAHLVFVVLGSVGLICLSVFDAYHHSTAHWSCTVLFIVGILLGVAFQVAEVYSLSRSHRGASRELFRKLFVIGSVKLIILLVAIAVAIAFCVLYVRCRGDIDSPRHDNCELSVDAASGCEWTVAFILFVFFWTYCADFYDARRRYNLLSPEEQQAVEKTENHQPLSSDAGSNHTNSAYPVPHGTQQPGTYTQAPPETVQTGEYGGASYHPPSGPPPAGAAPAAPATHHAFPTPYGTPVGQPTAPEGTYAPPAGEPPQRWVA